MLFGVVVGFGVDLGTLRALAVRADHLNMFWRIMRAGLGELGDGKGVVKVCRFNFNHEFFVCVFAQQSKRYFTDPKRGRRGDVVKKFLRQGRPLQLPRLRVVTNGDVRHCELDRCPNGSEWNEHMYDYRPVMCVDPRFGRLGKVLVKRYNPSFGSTNPVGQCLLRCNWDVQCMDRVYSLPEEWHEHAGSIFFAFARVSFCRSTRLSR